MNIIVNLIESLKVLTQWLDNYSNDISLPRFRFIEAIDECHPFLHQFRDYH